MKKLITEQDVTIFYNQGGSVLPLGPNDLLTPGAKDRIKYLNIKIVSKEEAEKIAEKDSSIIKSLVSKSVAIGSDHTGFKLKSIITKILVDKKFKVTDVGTYDEKSCDYPDFAFAVAKKVKERDVDWGIIIDASGNPSAMTANKLKGIRAATCYNEFTAKSAREHNNANILVLGAKAIGEETAKSILDAWLNTNFGGGRHQRRLNKIIEIENNRDN
ncbi:MAG TPA: ribose 5-phosphate isomerase B [Ignavibacteriaceae bacterium]|nr:ribose 5-phosphate isomerase B [Ignavibacteriaceae bacterium]